MKQPILLEVNLDPQSRKFWARYEGLEDLENNVDTEFRTSEWRYHHGQKVPAKCDQPEAQRVLHPYEQGYLHAKAESLSAALEKGRRFV